MVERSASVPLANSALFIGRLTLVVLLLAVIGYRLGLLSSLTLFWVFGIAVLCSIAVLLLAVLGLIRVWRDGSAGARQALWALGYGGVVALPFAIGAVFLMRYPALTDISTDPGEPPALVDGSGAERSTPTILAQIRAYPDVTGRRYDQTAEEMDSAIRGLLDDRGWAIVDERGDIISDGEVTYAVDARSLVLGLPVRFSVRLTDQDQSSYVDLRSASVHGRHDLGSNAGRIRSFMNALDGVLAEREAE